MTRKDGYLRCTSCSADFEYFLVHNGFNDSAYAYCDTCGRSTLLSIWAENIPEAVHFKPHQRIEPELEEWLKPCPCGGRFTAAADPRCPKCRNVLSAVAATTALQKNAPGTKGGWRWQQNWNGIYSIVIAQRFEQDNWKNRAKTAAV